MPNPIAEGHDAIAFAAFDHLPSDGSGILIDPEAAQRKIDIACQYVMYEYGLSEEEVDIIAGHALDNIRSAKQQISSVTVESLTGMGVPGTAIHEVTTTEDVYRKMMSTYKWHLKPGDGSYCPKSLELKNEVRDNYVLFDDSDLDTRIITVAAAKAHIDLVREHRREFDDTWSDPSGDGYNER